MLVKSLKEINVNEAYFPVFFQDNYLKHFSTTEKTGEALLYVNNVVGGIISFTTTKLKIITKGQYLFTPCDFVGKELTEEKEKYILEDFHKFLLKNKTVDVILPPSHFSFFRTIPSSCHYYPMGLIVYNVENKNGLFFESMKSNYRNEIRKLDRSSKLNFYNEESSFEKAYDLIQKTHKIQNKSFTSFNEFDSIKNNLNGNFLLKVCEEENSFLGCVLFIYDKDTAYYLYAGNEKTREYPGVNKKLLYLSFKDFNSMGLKKIILGGYKNSIFTSKKINDIQSFKLRFGAEIEHGYHFIKVINPVKYSIFKLLLKLKSKIKGKNLDLVNLDGLDINKSA